MRDHVSVLGIAIFFVLWIYADAFSRIFKSYSSSLTLKPRVEFFTSKAHGDLYRPWNVMNDEGRRKILIDLCDYIDETSVTNNFNLYGAKLIRGVVLTMILQGNYTEYVEISNGLASRVDRSDFPNVQDIKYQYPVINVNNAANTTLEAVLENAIPDCALPNKPIKESPIDIILMYFFRKIVQFEVGYKSDHPGIKGLVHEGRHYFQSQEGSPTNQHAFVKRALTALLTPVMPPFYRLFMAGVVPSKANNDPEWLVDIISNLVRNLPLSVSERLKPGTQLGPLPYAPFLTSLVTPPFLRFLVGPSRVNRRKDGGLGGLVVEKCWFLQESGCKGLCLHQCKIPAQEFFAETLKIPLTVSPNFVTQECQWSWGEEPLPADKDPSFPSNCIVGCPTRLKSSLGEIILSSSCSKEC